MKRWHLHMSPNCDITPEYSDASKTREIGYWALMTESTEEPFVTDYANDCDYVRWDDAESVMQERDTLRQVLEATNKRVAELEARLANLEVAAREMVTAASEYDSSLPRKPMLGQSPWPMVRYEQAKKVLSAHLFSDEKNR